MNHLLVVHIHNVYLGQIEVKCDSVLWLPLDHVTLLTSFQTKDPISHVTARSTNFRPPRLDRLPTTEVRQTAHHSGQTDCPPLRSHRLPTIQVRQTAHHSGQTDCPTLRSDRLPTTQVTQTAHHSGHAYHSDHIDCPPRRSHRLVPFLYGDGGYIAIRYSFFMPQNTVWH